MRRGCMFVLHGCSLAAMLMAAAASRAPAVPLSTLMPGGTLTCGSLRFSQFEYTASGANIPPAANIDATCVKVNGNDGIRFTASPAWTDTTANGAIQTARLAFVVQSTAGDRINGAVLDANPSVSAGGDGVASVGESTLAAGAG